MSRRCLRTGLLLVGVMLGLAPVAAPAQSAASGIYNEANELYREGHFDQARQRYRAAVELGVADPRLFYNLGNACYKDGRLGEAVVWYERALRLAPRDPDVLANLRFVRRVKRDQEPPEDSVLYRLYLWPTLGELLLLASGALLVLFVGASWRLLRQPGTGVRALLAVSAAIFLLAGTFAGSRLHRRLHLTEAVVVADEGTARSGPEFEQTPVFVIHEGTKVTVERREGDWYLVRLANGLGGWLPATVVTVI